MEQNVDPYLNPVINRDNIDNRNINAVFTDMNDHRSGTIVYWENVNRLTWRKVRTLVQHLKGTL